MCIFGMIFVGYVIVMAVIVIVPIELKLHRYKRAPKVGSAAWHAFEADRYDKLLAKARRARRPDADRIWSLGSSASYHRQRAQVVGA